LVFLTSFFANVVCFHQHYIFQYIAADYSAFGENLIGRELNGKGIQQGFNGKWNDFETGYQDYGFRNYSRKRRGFTTVDPLASKHPNQSPYLFCNGNPILYMDPDGRDGIITIKGGQINIMSNVYLYGAGAT
jgi:RHS repeat-associated protein